MKRIGQIVLVVLLLSGLVWGIVVVPIQRGLEKRDLQTAADTAIIMKAVHTTDVTVTYIHGADGIRTYDVSTPENKFQVAICSDGKDDTGCKVYSYVGEAISKR